MKNSRKGQSLIEILVAFAIAAIVLGSAVIGITVSLRSNLSSRLLRSGSAILQEMMDKAKLAAESDWHSFYNPTDKTLASYVAADGAIFRFVNGVEGVLESNIISGLVGYWKLDEADGTIAYDSAPGNLNKGTLTNGPVATAGCRVGGCLDFDGANDYIDIPHSASLEPQSVTVSAWVNLISKPTRHVVLVKWSGYTLEVSAIGLPVFQIWNGAQVGNTSGTALTFGNWAHIVGTFDNATKIIKTYLNGVEVATLTTVNPISYSGAVLKISACIYNCTYGKIDEPRVYNRALSAAEVAQLYQSRIYARSLVADDVYRNASGTIVTSGGTLDPSTQKITGTAVWGPTQITAAEYVTRSNSRVDSVTDWSDATTYSSQSNLDLTNPNEAKLIGI